MSTFRQRGSVQSPISSSRAQGDNTGSHPLSRGRVEELDSDDPEGGSDESEDSDCEEERRRNVDVLLIEEDSGSVGILDIFRFSFLLLIISAALSYYVTSDSIIWGIKRPWFTRWPVLNRYLRGPLLLTPAELSLYNGTSPSLPIYISINRTIYDVSANSGMYGPGASYNIFAGRDATRAFVTGCFAQDLTDDLRGVEEMFLPLDYDDESSLPSSEYEREYTLKTEMKEAKRMVKAQVQGWQDFYAANDKYFEVGKLVVSETEEAEGKKGEKRELCDNAQRSRQKRSEMKKEGAGVYGPMAERINKKKGKSEKT